MNKLTKGAIAGAAGIVLLMGGAGSLAYWTGSANLGPASTTITAGKLAVSGTSSTWKVGTKDASTVKIIPGTALTYTQTVTVDADGEGLKFKVNAAQGAISGVSGSTSLSSLLSNGTATLTSAAGTGTVTTTGSGTNTVYTLTGAGTTTFTVSFTVNWTSADTATNNTNDNAAQNGSATLGQNLFTVTQV